MIGSQWLNFRSSFEFRQRPLRVSTVSAKEKGRSFRRAPVWFAGNGRN
jgi:hypothetical protein